MVDAKKAPGPVGVSHSKEFRRTAREHAARSDDAEAFLPEHDPRRVHNKDDLAEELGKEFVTSATSGEESGTDSLNADVPEDLGGPFVEVAAAREFARGTDESNPEDAEPAELPTANATKR
jgi:hypothetical protein